MHLKHKISYALTIIIIGLLIVLGVVASFEMVERQNGLSTCIEIHKEKVMNNFPNCSIREKSINHIGQGLFIEVSEERFLTMSPNPELVFFEVSFATVMIEAYATVRWFIISDGIVYYTKFKVTL